MERPRTSVIFTKLHVLDVTQMSISRIITRGSAPTVNRFYLTPEPVKDSSSC